MRSTFSESTVKYTAFAWLTVVRGHDLTVCCGIENYKNSRRPIRTMQIVQDQAARKLLPTWHKIVALNITLGLA